MKALLCKEAGLADKLAIEEVDDPAAGKGQVLLDVHAAGLNFPDTLMISGKYQFAPDHPYIPGGEASGVVACLGEGVKGFAVGDRVIATMLTGAFAEKVVVPAAAVTAMPDEMEYRTGAGMSVTYGTSYHALKQCAGLKEGDTLLVLGAAGGVGLAAVELGNAMGAKVIAAASTDEKLAVAEAAGASMTVNYSDEDLKSRVKELAGPGGVDVVYDPVGGELSDPALRCLGAGGRFLVIGFAAGDIPRIPLNLVLLKECHIVGVFWGAWARREPKTQAKNVAAMMKMFRDGKIKPLVADVFEFRDYGAAFERITSRQAKGKVILELIPRD